MKEKFIFCSILVVLLACAGCTTNPNTQTDESHNQKLSAQVGQNNDEEGIGAVDGRRNSRSEVKEPKPGSGDTETKASEAGGYDEGSSEKEYPYKDYSPEEQGPSVVSYEPINDPFEKVNRVVFKFNDISYRYFLTPLAAGYKKITPDPVETGVSNVFDNIYEPISFLNHLFRLQPKSAVKSLSRFCINTTVGLLGIFDAADNLFELERDESTFANTLMDYDVGQGPYLVLPIIGPSNFRDGTSLLFDYFTNPLNAVNDEKRRLALKLFQSFEKRKDELDQYDDLVEDAEDPYTLLRGYYSQSDKRDAEYIQEQDKEKP